MTQRSLAWLLLVAVVVAVYAPGLHGPFVYDDHPNITGNALLHIEDVSPASLRQAALSSTAGPLRRPISMVSFGVNYALTGDDPFWFKLTNLAIHLLNTLLLGALVWQLAARAPALKTLPLSAHHLCLAVAALWALHPLQLTSVLYVVQRMNELSALFALVALIFYVRGRAQLDDGRRFGWLNIALALCAWMPLAVLSKENGILVCAYAWVIELFAFDNGATDASRMRRRRAFMAWSLAGIAGAVLLLRMRGMQFTALYTGKNFSGLEQLLTEPRVLLWYLRMLFAPDIRDMALVHDDWVVSTALFEPPVTAVAIAFWGIILASGIYFRSAAPWFGFGIWWFVAGHSLEAAPIGLDLVYEHRNYLPSAGPLLALVAGGSVLAHRYAAARRPIAAALLPLLAGVFTILTVVRVGEWRDIATWSFAQVEHRPSSAAAAYFLGGLYATLAEREAGGASGEALFASADDLFAKSAQLNPLESHAAISRVVLRQSLGKETPDRLYDDVVGRLARGRLDASAQTALTALMECSTAGKCSPQEDKLLLVVNAALNNPACTPIFASRLLTLLAEYYGHVHDNPRRAATYAKAATEIPGGDLASWFSLVRWLSRMGYWSQAVEALDELDRRDRKGALTQHRARAREELDEMIRSSRSTPQPSP